MSKAIIRIGYKNAFLAPSPAVGAKIIELLSKCVRVDDDREGKIWYPVEPGTNGALDHIDLLLLDDSRVRARVPKSRRLGFTPPLPDQATA